MPIETETNTQVMSREDAAALAEAVRLLEQTSFAARLTNVLGRQIALAGAILPERMRDAVSHAALSALEAALLAALRSLGKGSRPASPRLHKALAATSGAVGGAFGLALLPLELPISTTLILRSIADLGREEGEDLSQPEAALACLQVFALGGRTRGDEHVDGGYFAVRSLLANAVSESTRYPRRAGSVDRKRSRPHSLAGSDRSAVRYDRQRETRRSDDSHYRGDRRRQCELRLRRSFSGTCTRPFHRPSARTDLRRGRRAGGIRDLAGHRRRCLG